MCILESCVQKSLIQQVCNGAQDTHSKQAPAPDAAAKRWVTLCGTNCRGSDDEQASEEDIRMSGVPGNSMIFVNMYVLYMEGYIKIYFHRVYSVKDNDLKISRYPPARSGNKIFQYNRQPSGVAWLVFSIYVLFSPLECWL